MKGGMAAVLGQAQPQSPGPQLGGAGDDDQKSSGSSSLFLPFFPFLSVLGSVHHAGPRGEGGPACTPHHLTSSRITPCHPT